MWVFSEHCAHNCSNYNVKNEIREKKNTLRKHAKNNSAKNARKYRSQHAFAVWLVLRSRIVLHYRTILQYIIVMQTHATPLHDLGSRKKKGKRYCMHVVQSIVVICGYRPGLLVHDSYGWKLRAILSHTCVSLATRRRHKAVIMLATNLLKRIILRLAVMQMHTHIHAHSLACTQCKQRVKKSVPTTNGSRDTVHHASL